MVGSSLSRDGDRAGRYDIRPSCSLAHAPSPFCHCLRALRADIRSGPRPGGVSLLPGRRASASPSAGHSFSPLRPAMGKSRGRAVPERGGTSREKSPTTCSRRARSSWTSRRSGENPVGNEMQDPLQRPPCGKEGRHREGRRGREPGRLVCDVPGNQPA